MDRDEIYKQVSISEQEISDFRKQWLGLVDASVFAPIRSDQINLTNRLSKRVFEVGASLKSMSADRAWIPHPREQLKNALGSSVKLRDAMQAVDSMLPQLKDDEASNKFVSQWKEFQNTIIEFLAPLENRWAEILDSQLNDSIDDEDE
ncbi:MAG: hypothetical protein OEZ47_06975 [Gammaproteobacteria bacterium]|nr:hypothetical protein [Gammaproteobacteria bacterium]